MHAMFEGRQHGTQEIAGRIRLGGTMNPTFFKEEAVALLCNKEDGFVVAFSAVLCRWAYAFNIR
jgi:hypothetical protein